MMTVLRVVLASVAAVSTAHISPPASCQGHEYSSSDDGQCCPLCLEGMKVNKDCTEYKGTRCGHCETGTFMNKPNGLKECRPCTSCNQGDGLLVKQECTNTSDTVCDALSGYFCRNYSDDTGCSLASKHSRCAAGQRIKDHGTARRDTVCEDCQQGYFSVDGVNCTLWTSL
ncbi:tumor necrosis factor receptor superfamily member 14-like isoform X2 [Cololabis saira]|uniref:tumor necrosis factor receptor superfamily member 14-like isoform X2 n=1 Tax=Cololabis saira TaxID=129043 RepID=UPI002AD35EBB|nr:tumor necrosis factor receptor superfamily member 14-like isoform X2 [Cololabis saira]XP_061590762.1 tumor necrosis factor receptor superfamily member 14-like isoform X2 [Cololabis saira]